jgi:hypothetical protein
MATPRLDDFSTSHALDSGYCREIDPGFNENGSLGFGSGNFTGSGPSTGARPLIAASYICHRYINWLIAFLQNKPREKLSFENNSNQAQSFCTICTFLSKLYTPWYPRISNGISNFCIECLALKKKKNS